MGVGSDETRTKQMAVGTELGGQIGRHLGVEIKKNAGECIKKSGVYITGVYEKTKKIRVRP